MLIHTIDCWKTASFFTVSIRQKKSLKSNPQPHVSESHNSLGAFKCYFSVPCFLITDGSLDMQDGHVWSCVAVFSQLHPLCKRADGELIGID